MALEDNLQLISYLAASEIYNSGKNIYECFLPVVESVLMNYINKSKITLEKLHNEINRIYHLDVPKSTLKSSLQLLHQQKKIKILDYKRIYLNKNEINISFWGNREDRENEIEDFFLEFNNFLVQAGVDIPLTQIKEDCCNWLYYNTLELASFIDKGSLSNKIHLVHEYTWNVSEHLVNFLLESKKRKTGYFTTFLSLYNGAVQSSLFNFDKKKIDNFCQVSIPFSNIILDSNFILRILNVQSEFDSTIAIETLNVLKEHKSNFFILEQTLEEIQRSVKSFLFEYEPYTVYTRNYFKNSQIRLTGFWEATRRGVTKEDLLKLTNKTALKEQILNLIDVTFVDNFDDTQISQSQIEDLIESKKRGNYGESQARHDLCLIAYCIEKRNNNIDNISKIEWWVLTNDERLTYWNQQNSGQYQECLTEIQLGNLIWIQQKKFDNSGLMQTIVSIASSMAVNQTEFENFIRKVHTYQQNDNEDNINLNKLSIIFANNMLTTADIQRINAEEDALEQILTEKTTEIKIKQAEQDLAYEIEKKNNTELSDRNNELTKRIKSLEMQLATTTCQHKKEKFKRDIEELKKEKRKYLETLEVYDILNKYQKEHQLSTSRYTVLLCIPITLFVILILYLYRKLLYPYLLGFLEKIDNTSIFIQSMIYTWGIPIIIVPLYYWLITLIYGSPLAPKELFHTIENKIFKFRIKRYMQKNKISLSYKLDNIESIILQIKSDIDIIDKSIHKLNDNISEVEAELFAL